MRHANIKIYNRYIISLYGPTKNSLFYLILNPYDDLGNLEESNVYVLKLIDTSDDLGQYELYPLSLTNIWKIGLDTNGQDLFLDLDGHLHYPTVPIVSFESYSYLHFIKDSDVNNILDLCPYQLSYKSNDPNLSGTSWIVLTRENYSDQTYRQLTNMSREVLVEISKTIHLNIENGLTKKQLINRMLIYPNIGEKLMELCDDISNHEKEHKWKQKYPSRKITLCNMTLKLLRPYAKQIGVNKHYRLKKSDLIEAILDKEKDNQS